MASTHGRKPLPIPASAVDGLEGLGFVRREQDEWVRPVVFRHKKHPHIMVELATMNLPGSTQLLAKWNGQPTTRIEIDLMLQRLTAMVGRLEASVQQVPR